MHLVLQGVKSDRWSPSPHPSNGCLWVTNTDREGHTFAGWSSQNTSWLSYFWHHICDMWSQKHVAAWVSEAATESTNYPDGCARLSKLSGIICIENYGTAPILWINWIFKHTVWIIKVLLYPQNNFSTFQKHLAQMEILKRTLFVAPFIFQRVHFLLSGGGAGHDSHLPTRASVASFFPCVADGFWAIVSGSNHHVRRELPTATKNGKFLGLFTGSWQMLL